MDTAVEPLVYSPDGAAHALCCSRQFIYKLIRSGELRAVKIGRVTRIPADDVRRLAGGDPR